MLRLSLILSDSLKYLHDILVFGNLLEVTFSKTLLLLISFLYSLLSEILVHSGFSLVERDNKELKCSKEKNNIEQL